MHAMDYGVLEIEVICLHPQKNGCQVLTSILIMYTFVLEAYIMILHGIRRIVKRTPQRLLILQLHGHVSKAYVSTVPL